MKARNVLFIGMMAAFSFYGCSKLVEVDEHAPEATGDCLDCHASQNILQKLVAQEENTSSGGG